MSRPTFIEYRKKVRLIEVKKGRSTYFKKIEILNKLYAPAFRVQPTVEFVLINPNFDMKHILVDEFTIDLRMIRLLDPYGIVSLLCYVISLVSRGENVFLICEESVVTSQLVAAGFFKELERRFLALTHWDVSVVGKSNPSAISLSQVYLPLREIRVKGQDRTVLNELLLSLLRRGFSETLAGYIGWILGELADNSLTHAKGPCYIMFTRYENEGVPYLEFAVGDSGVGIHKSLQTNQKYSQLNNPQALLKAFQSHVSSWPDSAERGKGLCDLLTVALGNGGWAKVDANEIGLFFNFTAGQRVADFSKPLAEISGTRFGIILFEKEFSGAARDEIDSFLSAEIKKYE